MLLFLFTLVLSVGCVLLVLRLAFSLQKRIGFLHDPVYVPSSASAIETMILLSGIKRGDKVIDFGSGDGRVVIALAKKGCVAAGYEIDPFLVWESRKKIRQLGLERNAKIYWKSFWHANLKECDAVFLYTTESIMPKLAEKLRKELPKGAKIISQRFPFPLWQPVKHKHDVYLYSLK